VELFVSSGKPLKAVPNVVGQSQSSATSALQSAGFNVQATTQPSSTVKTGDVISQSPSGGAKATAGSTVTIVVAKKQKPTNPNVPNVKGQTAATAASALQSAGFTVTQTPRSVKKKSENGVVLSQSPGGGTSAKKGSTVTIVVGQYIAPTSSTTTSPTTTPTTTT
jgi:serine/threonine-protein kinase